MIISQHTLEYTLQKQHALSNRSLPAAPAARCWPAHLWQAAEARGPAKCSLVRLGWYLNLQPLQLMLTPHTILGALAACFDSDPVIGYLPFLPDELLLNSSSPQQDPKPCRGTTKANRFLSRARLRLLSTSNLVLGGCRRKSRKIMGMVLQNQATRPRFHLENHHFFLNTERKTKQQTHKNLTTAVSAGSCQRNLLLISPRELNPDRQAESSHSCCSQTLSS